MLCLTAVALVSGAILEMADDGDLNTLVFGTSPDTQAKVSATCGQKQASVSTIFPRGPIEKSLGYSTQDTTGLQDFTLELAHVAPTCANVPAHRFPCVPHNPAMASMFKCKWAGEGGAVEMTAYPYVEWLYFDGVRTDSVVKVNCTVPPYAAIQAASGFNGKEDPPPLSVSMSYYPNSTTGWDLPFAGQPGTNTISFTGFSTPPAIPPSPPPPTPPLLPGTLYYMTDQVKFSLPDQSTKGTDGWYPTGASSTVFKTQPFVDQIPSDYIQLAKPKAGFITWTVPMTGTWTVEATGAQGGCTAACRSNNRKGAPGAVVGADIDFVAGEKLIIAPGSGGGNGYGEPYGNEAGGGGGSFVVRHGGDDDPFGALEPLLVAGGGGGVVGTSYGNNNCGSLIYAQGKSADLASETIKQGGSSSHSMGKSGCSSSYWINEGATGGTGGLTTGSYEGSAGGGFYSSGQMGGYHGGNRVTSGTGGQSYKDGHYGKAYNLYGGKGCTQYGSSLRNGGGFGGGGAGCLASAGGGGGYSGGHASGGWSSWSGYGGGGTSYIHWNSKNPKRATGAGPMGTGATSTNYAGMAGYITFKYKQKAPPPPPLPPSRLYDFKRIEFQWCTQGQTYPYGQRDGCSKANMKKWFDAQAAAGAQNISAIENAGGISFADPYPGFYTWTVPMDGYYRINAAGGQGGCSNSCRGTGFKGAPGSRAQGDFKLEKSSKLYIAVGSGGGNGYGSPYGNDAGGGGGSFVTDSITAANPLIAAGGGGGSGGASYGGNNCVQGWKRGWWWGRGEDSDRSKSTYCGFYGTLPSPPAGYGGNTVGSHRGGAGGGWTRNGANGNAHGGNSGTSCTGGDGFKSTSRFGSAYKLQGGKGATAYGAGKYKFGGFGGGGGGCLGSPGGAGGYTGGNAMGSWSSWAGYGGGGGSYVNSGAVVSGRAQTHAGAGNMWTDVTVNSAGPSGSSGANGFVTIDYLGDKETDGLEPENKEQTRKFKTNEW